MSNRTKPEASKPTATSQTDKERDEQFQREAKRQLLGQDWNRLSWKEAEKEQDRIFKQCSEKTLSTCEKSKDSIDEMNRSMPDLPNSLASPLPDAFGSSSSNNGPRSSLVSGGSRRRSSLLSRSSLREITCLNDFSFGVLPGYQAQLDDEAVLHSEDKLDKAADELRPFVDGKKCPIISVPCRHEEETVGYRCKCSFQIMYDGSSFRYAMRSKGEPVLLESSVFLIANQRIQMAMEGLLDQVLNANASADDGGEAKDPSPYPNIVNEHLASVTFASSWNEERDKGDCIVTMNYSAAVETADTNWLEEAKQIVRVLKITQLHVRSKKVVLSAVSGGLDKCWGSFLRDTIYLVPPLVDGEFWDVSCHTQQHAIPVHYQKPEGAFFHPNAGVMCQALSWMLDRISKIAESSPQSPRLLEMYCGCGAHTLALARSGILASIQAVEYDQRLVEACETNIELNLTKAQPEDIQMSPVQVVKGDAGRWAQKHRKRREASQDIAEEDHFDILLVDPPRQGLDSQVVDLAIQTESIQHVLIISCGLQALVRDLKLLCSDFEIINCEQLDLFPRTDSVETLIHLRRR